MSYPPPNPDQYALNGYKFFRLNTPLISDGDMYESQQGANGFAIGPDSDISKVNIGYFDEQNFGEGYGEENDYCLRANKAGWALAVADESAASAISM